MERALILDCINKVGEEVKVYGFVQTKRDHGKIAFLDVADRSGMIQVVIGGGKGADLKPQDIVCVSGKVNKRPEHLINKNIPTGKIEIYSESVEVLSKAAELPFDMGGKDLDLQLPTLLDYRSLTLRHPKIKAIFKVQDKILEGFRSACKKRDCIEIVVPTTAISSTEGGAEVFNIDYYGHKAFLTQSPQLYKQMMVPIFERVWTIAHAYRAEPSVTTRHLSETTQMDCEFGFVDFNGLMDLYEGTAMEMIKLVEESCRPELKLYAVEQVLYGKIPRLKLREAQEVIFKEFGRDVRREKDLAPADETDICKWAKEKHKSDFVTITHFPTLAKPFYTMPDPENSEYTLSYDLLFRGVEVLSGSQRINDYNQLVDSIKNRGMNPQEFEMYLQAFKFGMPPEGGFSFGLERLTMLVLGLKNIREGSLFPRDMERVDIKLSQNSNRKSQN